MDSKGRDRSWRLVGLGPAYALESGHERGGAGELDWFVRPLGRLARWLLACVRAGTSDVPDAAAACPPAWSCTLRAPAREPHAAGAPDVRVRRVRRGAARNLIMLPLTLVPTTMGGAMREAPLAAADPPRRDGSRPSLAHPALVRAWSATPLEGPLLLRKRAGDAVAPAPNATCRMRDAGAGRHDVFVASPAGAVQQRALAQQAIATGDAAAADAAFATLQQAGHPLQPAERSQWFALLLQQRKVDAALALQQVHGDLRAPLQQLAMAHALAECGRRSELIDFLQTHQPTFAREVQERQWLYLLAHVDDARPELLRRHRVRFAANRAVQARLASPAVASPAADARPVGAWPPARDFAGARFALALRAGRFDEALRWCPQAEPSSGDPSIRSA